MPPRRDHNYEILGFDPDSSHVWFIVLLYGQSLLGRDQREFCAVLQKGLPRHDQA